MGWTNNASQGWSHSIPSIRWTDECWSTNVYAAQIKAYQFLEYCYNPMILKEDLT